MYKIWFKVSAGTGECMAEASTIPEIQDIWDNLNSAGFLMLCQRP